MNRKGIAVAGTLIADVFYRIDTYPEEGMLSQIRAMSRNVGGSGNLVTDLAKIDPAMPVRVCALLGDDDNGAFVRARLAEHPNIDLAGVGTGSATSVTHVMNATDTMQRTFYFLPAASDEFCEASIDWDAIDADIFQLEYLLLMDKVDADDPEYGTHGARILAEAQRRGMKTSIDIVSEQGDRAARVVRSALRYTDICSINEIEAQAVTGVRICDADGRIDGEMALQALGRLVGMGVSDWAVIHAPACGYGYDVKAGEFCEVPSLHHPEGFIKGTNGAGDAYCAGLLYGAYTEMGLERAMRFAAATATCSLSEENGTDGLRPADEVWKVDELYRPMGEWM